MELVKKKTNKRSVNIDIKIIKEDITTREVDAVVNAAHEGLTGGGGVDGAIHHAAEQKLLEECLRLYGCPEGEARITNGYNLSAKYIIHTVGPVWVPGVSESYKQSEAYHLLSNCYRNCLNLAKYLEYQKTGTNLYSIVLLLSTRFLY